MISTSPDNLLSQIFITRPSGYCGAHKSMRQMGRKYVAINDKAAKPTINWENVFNFLIRGIEISGSDGSLPEGVYLAATFFSASRALVAFFSASADGFLSVPQASG